MALSLILRGGTVYDGTGKPSVVATTTMIADMVRHLITNQVPVVGVEPERNELERIFLEATRGDLQ